MARPYKAYKDAKASVGLSLLDIERFMHEVERFVIDVQVNIVTKAVEAGVAIVLPAMISNTPQSTGSRAKMSNKSRSYWSGSKRLKYTIKAVVRKRVRFGIQHGAVGLVGPDYMAGGGHGNLFSKDHKRKVYWGKDAGTTRVVNQFVKKTADETRSQTEAAVSSALKSGIEAAASRMQK